MTSYSVITVVKVVDPALTVAAARILAPEAKVKDVRDALVALLDPGLALTIDDPLHHAGFKIEYTSVI